MGINGTHRWTVTDERSVHEVVVATFAEVSRLAARLAGSDRALAEDLVQDTYVGLVQAVRQRQVDEVGVGWLLTSVRHRFIDHHRRAGRLDRSLRLVAAGAAGSEVVGGDRTDAVESVDLLRPLHRVVLLLHDVEGFTSAEIASELGMGKRTVEAALADARRAARRLLEGEDR
jgi:RNA polymerase sigma-70 factor, ECF subfamily